MNFANGLNAYPLDIGASIAGSLPTEKVTGIYNLCRQLVSTNTLDVILDSIVRQAVDILHVRFSRIMILEADGSFNCQAAHATDGISGLRTRGARSADPAQVMYQQVVLSEAPALIERGSALSPRMRFALRLNYNDSLYLLPLRVSQDTVGVLALGEAYSVQPETTLKEKIRLAVMIADQAAGAIYRARLTNRLEESQLQTVMALAKMIESRDAYVGQHCRKVTDLSVRLAHRMDCSPIEVQYIRWAAMLHDIGKVGIRDNILHKNASLTGDEWGEMRRHPENGAEIVRMSSNLNFVAAIILAHHERYDGSGYPNCLKREMIPFGARILAVADAFSAMTEDRPYRKKLTHEEAIAEIKHCSGTQFDPRVVEAFIAIID